MRFINKREITFKSEFGYNLNMFQVPALKGMNVLCAVLFSYLILSSCFN